MCDSILSVTSLDSRNRYHRYRPAHSVVVISTAVAVDAAAAAVAVEVVAAAAAAETSDPN